MNCPICQSSDVRVERTLPDAKMTARRRACSRCGHRWTTVEISDVAFARLQKFEELARAIMSENDA